MSLDRRQKRSDPHKVDAVTGGVFHVTSGRSGSVYTVTPTGGGDATCNCAYGQHAKAGKVCSHVEAVRDFSAGVLALPPLTVTADEVFERIEAEQGARASACTCGAEAAGRAHRVDPFCPALNPPERGEFTGMLCVRCKVAIGSDGLCPSCRVDHSGQCHLCRASGYHRDECPEIEPEPTVEDVAREMTFVPTAATTAAKRS